MKKIFILFLLVLSAKAGYSQHKGKSTDIKKLAQDTIIWRNDSVLTTEDFKSKPKGNSNALALTTSGILFHADPYNPSVFFVEAIFVKSKSFMRQDARYVLKHEQLHFDITELYSRKLRQTIQETDFKKVNHMSDQINRMYNKVAEELSREQQKYDKDTENGTNAAKQQVWNDDISRQLHELDAYSSTQINIVK